MATKTIAWTTGSGNITLTYTGQGNGSISVSSSSNEDFEERSQSINIVTTAGSSEKAISVLIKQQGKKYPVGEVFNFSYTGSVQQITLPKGKYKLQCWGAQGGGSFSLGKDYGSKGGYSEGVLTLDKTTTLYIFVGGQGSYGSTTSLVNGGWNGGGAAVGKTQYNSGDTNGFSYIGSGGGATDISTVASSMSYSSGRTNRSSASLLARCIVAGGGAGASYRETITTTTSTTTKKVVDSTAFDTLLSSNIYFAVANFDISECKGKTVTFSCTSSSNATIVEALFYNASGTMVDNNQASASSLTFKKAISSTSAIQSVRFRARASGEYPTALKCVVSFEESTTSTSTTSGYSNKNQQGGGASGKGQYPGTQSSAGSGGGFGYGKSQSSTGYRYSSGGGGSGWYGGGAGQSDTSTLYVNYSGGGSGFVNTSANSSYRPSGYTGLQLDSGTTTAGSSSFESTSGGTETGHSGNGYARITVIE